MNNLANRGINNVLCMAFIVTISLSRNRYFPKDSLRYQDLSLTIVHRNAGSIRSVTLHYSFHISFTIHLFLEIDGMETQHAIFLLSSNKVSRFRGCRSSSKFIRINF